MTDIDYVQMALNTQSLSSEFRGKAQKQYDALRDRVEELAKLLDDFAPYLKEGETPYHRFKRERQDLCGTLVFLARDRNDAMRYRWMKKAQEHGEESVTEWIGRYSADQWDAEIDKHRESEIPATGLPANEEVVRE